MSQQKNLGCVCVCVRVLNLSDAYLHEDPTQVVFSLKWGVNFLEVGLNYLKCLLNSRCLAIFFDLFGMVK